MSLFPGDARANPAAGGPAFILDITAVQESMAFEMENALADLYQRLNGVALPDMTKDETRLLFVAISRGLLKYLSDHQVVLRASANVAGSGPTRTVDHFNLHVTMDHHDPDV